MQQRPRPSGPLQLKIEKQKAETDCEREVPNPKDAPPIRSPQAVHSFIAQHISGRDVVEIGTRNGDGIQCFVRHARRATAVEISRPYCDSLRRISQEMESRQSGSGFSITCSDYRTGGVLDGDVITWWEQPPLYNVAALKHLQGEQQAARLRPGAEAALLFDSSWADDNLSWRRLCPIAGWSAKVAFDERARCQKNTEGRTIHKSEQCYRAAGFFIVAGIPISRVPRLENVTEAESLECEQRHEKGRQGPWRQHWEPWASRVGAQWPRSEPKPITGSNLGGDIVSSGNSSRRRTFVAPTWLAATSVHSHARSMPDLLSSAVDLVEVYPHLSFLVNFFDAGVVPISKLLQEHTGHNPLVEGVQVPGMKTLFWKRVLTPLMLRRRHIKVLWLVDSDVAVHPSVFPLGSLVSVLSATHATLLQPSIRGNLANGGTHHPWLRQHEAHMACVATTARFVEVQTPLFATEAWIVFYERVLSKLADDHLADSDFGLDLVWCAILREAFPRRPTCLVTPGLAASHLNTQQIRQFMPLERRERERSCSGTCETLMASFSGYYENYLHDTGACYGMVPRRQGPIDYTGVRQTNSTSSSPRLVK